MDNKLWIYIKIVIKKNYFNFVILKSITKNE